jgi:Sulfotransferase family
VRLSADHAVYLKWLFPRAKFLFLIRNPYEAWRLYAARAAKGWKWYNHWPDESVTVHGFAAHWQRLVTSFLNDHRNANGLVVRYEDLERGDYAAVEDHLGFALSREAGHVNPSDGGPPPLMELPESDRAALEERLGTLAASLGYAYHTGDHQPAQATAPAGREAPQTGTLDIASPNEIAGKGQSRASPTDPAKCVVLVPVGDHIEPMCDDALRTLEWRGYAVRRVRGYSAIDQGRNQIATNALRDGFEELLWIDSDIAFEPDAVERLRSHALPITCGVYPKKGNRSFSSSFSSGTRQVLFGSSGGLIEIPYAGAGFLHTRREVYHAVQRRFRLPVCNERFGPSMIPFFQPLVVPDGVGHWYLAEDYSFCYRARECGYAIMADTTIRLMHIGTYAYGWEDAGGERPRYGDYTFHVRD